MTFLFLVVAMILAYECAQRIVVGDLESLGYIGVTALIGAFLLRIVRNWRTGIYSFLIWLLFEDCARKFFGNNLVLYFAKDFLVLLIYLLFYAAYRRKSPEVQTFRPPFLAAALLLIWFGAMQIFNPASSSIFFGLMGMKLYFYYVPLVFVGYACIESERTLRRFFFVNLGVMLVIIGLGIAQSIIGPRFLNPTVLQADIRTLSETYRVAPVSGAIVYRPNSVFVSTGRFGNMLTLAWILVFGFSGYLLLRQRAGRLFAFVALSFTAAGCLMCASRGTVMWSLGTASLGTVAFIWGAPWRQGEALRIFRTLQRAAIGVALAITVLLIAYPQAFLGRIAVYSETLDPRSPRSELVHRVRDYPLANFMAAFDYPRWPYGYGIGTISLGGQYVSRIFGVRPTVGGVESGYGALIVEMGILGLILWIIMSVAIVVSAWKVVRKLKGSPFFPLAFMIFLYAGILLFPMTFAGLQPYQDFVLNSYLWLLLGILFRLPKIAAEAQLAAMPAIIARQASGT